MPVRVLSFRPFTVLAGLLAVLLAGSLGGCGALAGDDGSADDAQVVAAFYPLAYVAQRVAGDHLDVANLTNAGGEPHDLELSIAQTAALADAALVVHLDGFQPAVDEAVEQNADGAVLDVADVVELEESSAHHDDHAHGEEESHGDEDVDPHFWLDPLLMSDLADAVAEEMAAIDPEHAADYEDNAAGVRADLEALDEAYATGLASCARDTVVVNHDAFGYLSRYGLHFEPIAGLSPGAEPTPADLARLHALIREEGVTTVFSETLVSPKTAETLARDLGIEAEVLDPVEGLSDRTRDEDYLSLMRSNLEKLREAGGC